jgi:hypothetical protein
MFTRKQRPVLALCSIVGEEERDRIGCFGVMKGVEVDIGLDTAVGRGGMSIVVAAK